jgi:hypothetical protein
VDSTLDSAYSGPWPNLVQNSGDTGDWINQRPLYQYRRGMSPHIPDPRALIK